MWRRAVGVAGLAIAVFAAVPAGADEDFGSWALHRSTFPSTGGGGYVIHDYNPVVADGRCTTDFRVTGPDGSEGRNTVVFDAVPVQGGILCTNGRWRALDGGASGTTPYRMFLKDGVWRGSAS